MSPQNSMIAAYATSNSTPTVTAITCQLKMDLARSRLLRYWRDWKLLQQQSVGADWWVSITFIATGVCLSRKWGNVTKNVSKESKQYFQYLKKPNRISKNGEVFCQKSFSDHDNRQQCMLWNLRWIKKAQQPTRWRTSLYTELRFHWPAISCYNMCGSHRNRQ